jgi:predicted GNAT family acetyltransferase
MTGMEETPTIDVRDNPENRTYEARMGDEVVGTLVYELQGNRTVLTHTWVEPSHREHGVATDLSRGALDDLREKNRKVTVFCTFTAEFIGAHPEYADLLDPDHPGVPHHI